MSAEPVLNIQIFSVQLSRINLLFVQVILILFLDIFLSKNKSYKGYESIEFFDNFLVKGKFNEKLETTVISHIKKLNNVR